MASLMKEIFSAIRCTKLNKGNADVFSVKPVKRLSAQQREQRIKHFSWNTIARWQYLARRFAGRFNDNKLKNIDLKELQLDEIQRFVGKKKNQIWIFSAIEVWSRLWITHLAGKHNYQLVQPVYLPR